MNNKAHLRPKDYDSNGDIIPMACKEEKGDLISRSYIVEVYNRVKEACKNCDNYNGVRCRACDIGDELLDLQDIIDNAPAVNPCDNCDLYFIAKTKEEMRKGGAE